MRRTVRVSGIGVDTWAFDTSRERDDLEIEIGADVPDAAVFDIATATDEAEVYRFHRITLADLRAYLEQRDAYVAASTASRLGQSAQIEEVK